MALILTCRSCTDTYDNCCGDNVKVDIFNGIEIANTETGKATYIHAPFSASFIGSKVKLTGNDGVSIEVDLANTVYNSISELKNIVTSCKCPTSSGGGGILDGDVPAAVNVTNSGNLTFDSGTDNTGVVFNGTGNKVATFNGNIDVTGLIDPTGMQFSGPQVDATMPNGTIYVTDGSTSGFPSGSFVFKDLGGLYFDLQTGTAEVTGQLVGSAATFAALPTTDALGDPVSNGDWAVLTADDGGNTSGIYAYNGSAYVFVMEIADTFVLVEDVLTSTSTVNALSANQGKVLKDEQDNITSALGQGAAATDMGTYTGSTISDNQSAKQNIQELETALESIKPTVTDSDGGHEIVSYDGTNFEQVALNSLRLPVLLGAPVDGTTIAYYNGQVFYSITEKTFYEALTVSTDPDLDGTGSTFAAIPTSADKNVEQLTLTITATGATATLANTPLDESKVIFAIEGIEYYEERIVTGSGITISGSSVTFDNTGLGFVIDTETVVAKYES